MDETKEAVSSCSLLLAEDDYIHTACCAIVEAAVSNSRGALLDDGPVDCAARIGVFAIALMVSSIFCHSSN